MSVRIAVYAPHSGEVEVSSPIEYTIMGDKDGIKAALIESVEKIARAYELDVEIH